MRDSADQADREIHWLRRALLGVRVFFGGTFLYAGLDKLTDPAFLSPSGLGSIGSQLQAYLSVSPLAPLVRAFAMPAPVVVGTLIAIAEIAVGLGVLSGLLFRISAFGGLALSLLFWLTASWSVQPFYYGADLPYAAGWLLLLVAGDGGDRPARILDRFLPPPGEPPRRGEVVTRRQTVRLGIQLAMVAVASMTVGAAAWLVSGGPSRRPARPLTGAVDASPGASGGPGTAVAIPVPSSSAPALPATGASLSPRATPAATPALAGQQVALVSDVKPHQALAITDPLTGDPAFLFKLASGRVACFDALCTHEGCPVEFDPSSELLFCPCHGAVFDPARGAKVLRGPTRRPLAELPLTIDPQTGAITLTG